MEPYNLDASLDSYKMFVVKRSELDSRMDPIFYGSDLTKFNKYFPSVKLSSVVSSFKSGVGAGKQDQAEGDEGIIQIRPTNIDNFGNLKFDKNVYLPYGFKGDKLKLNDVLFNNTNSQELVGKTTILLEEKELFYSNHITKIVVDQSQVLPLYIWIILNIYQENKIFYALCTNWNNQSGVGLELLKSLPIPLPPIQIQESIVSIIQNAYAQKQAKEAEAKELLASIDTYLLNELGITLPEKDNSLEARIFTTKFSEVGRRFDPISFKTSFKNFLNGTYASEALKNVILKFKSGQGAGRDDQSDEELGIIQIRPTNIGDNGNLKFHKNVYIPLSSGYDKLDLNDVLFNNTNSQELVGKTTVLKENLDLTYSNHITVLKVNEHKLNADYLGNILNSFQKHKIFYSICTNWNNQSGVGLDLLKNIQIPLPPLEKQNEIVEHIAAIRANAKALQEIAEQILTEAKQQIEQIILG